MTQQHRKAMQRGTSVCKREVQIVVVTLEVILEVQVVVVILRTGSWSSSSCICCSVGTSDMGNPDPIVGSLRCPLGGKSATSYLPG